MICDDLLTSLYHTSGWCIHVGVVTARIPLYHHMDTLLLLLVVIGGSLLTSLGLELLSDCLTGRKVSLSRLGDYESTYF